MKRTIEEVQRHAGSVIRKERTHKRISQEVLAERTGTTAWYISQLENGRQCAKLMVYLSIANELDIDLGVLFTGIRG